LCFRYKIFENILYVKNENFIPINSHNLIIKSDNNDFFIKDLSDDNSEFINVGDKLYIVKDHLRTSYDVEEELYLHFTKNDDFIKINNDVLSANSLLLENINDNISYLFLNKETI
jgi:hypothetical protein